MNGRRVRTYVGKTTGYAALLWQVALAMATQPKRRQRRQKGRKNNG